MSEAPYGKCEKGYEGTELKWHLKLQYYLQMPGAKCRFKNWPVSFSGHICSKDLLRIIIKN